MRKAFLLLLWGTLCLTACQERIVPDAPSDDDKLEGTSVDVSAFPRKTGKLFILNEGGMGSNNASLDFIRFKSGTYVTGAFKKMNPDVGAGLGDVGNDIVIHDGEAWIAVNNSGLVEVISAKDERESATIAIPTPRSIAFDGKYAYVSSWAGAFASYDLDYNLTDYANPKGQVYKVDIQTRTVLGSVEVGYQPEGIAVYGGKIYVANSGGLTLPPNYSYDKTVSVIDVSSFKVSATLEIADNLQKVYSDGKGNIYVTTFGDYYSQHSALWQINTKDGNKAAKIGDYATYSAILDDTVYCIGNENEFDYKAAKVWKSWSCKNGEKGTFNLNLNGINPYGLFVASPEVAVIADAGDYFNPGTVSLFEKGEKKWTVTAGVCPGHFALY